jgi:hypothetical protein
LQLKLKIKKRPHSFNHNCNHYSLSGGERQQKKKKKKKNSFLTSTIKLFTVVTGKYCRKKFNITCLSLFF